MARFAQEDKVEQMNAQKRRLCIEHHKREAARLIAEKQNLLAAAKVNTLCPTCLSCTSSLAFSEALIPSSQVSDGEGSLALFSVLTNLRLEMGRNMRTVTLLTILRMAVSQLLLRSIYLQCLHLT